MTWGSIRRAGIALLLLLCVLVPRTVMAGPTTRTVQVRVVAVHDGDTVSVTTGGKKERVRLLGIDAPELAQGPWGARSRTYLRELLAAAGNSVSLEFDIERRDKYGRLLAYAWTADSRMVNLEMVRNGYAVLYTFPPNVKYVEQLREAQRAARGKGLGIWGSGGLKELPSDYRRRHPR